MTIALAPVVVSPTVAAQKPQVTTAATVYQEGAHRGALQCAVPHGIAHLERQRCEGAGFYVDATEPRWSAAPVQAVSNAAPAPVVECIALAAVVYAAQAFEVEWIAPAPA